MTLDRLDTKCTIENQIKIQPSSFVDLPSCMPLFLGPTLEADLTTTNIQKSQKPETLEDCCDNKEMNNHKLELIESE